MINITDYIVKLTNIRDKLYRNKNIITDDWLEFNRVINYLHKSTKRDKVLNAFFSMVNIHINEENSNEEEWDEDAFNLRNIRDKNNKNITDDDWVTFNIIINYLYKSKKRDEILNDFFSLIKTFIEEEKESE